jgi:hypothetical protein
MFVELTPDCLAAKFIHIKRLLARNEFNIRFPRFSAIEANRPSCLESMHDGAQSPCIDALRITMSAGRVELAKKIGESLAAMATSTLTRRWHN